MRRADLLILAFEGADSDELLGGIVEERPDYCVRVCLTFAPDTSTKDKEIAIADAQREIDHRAPLGYKYEVVECGACA